MCVEDRQHQGVMFRHIAVLFSKLTASCIQDQLESHVCLPDPAGCIKLLLIIVFQIMIIGLKLKLGWKTVLLIRC